MLRKTAAQNINSKNVHNGVFGDNQMFGPNRERPNWNHSNLPGISNVPSPWQTLIFAPWDRERGNGYEQSPSIGTTITAMFLMFVACLTYGWAYCSVIDAGVASGVTEYEQAIIFAFVAAAGFVLTMSWTWDPQLPTHVNSAILAAGIGTFDLGILPFLLCYIVQGAGFAAAGGIMSALGLRSDSLANKFLPIFSTEMNGSGAKSAWLYWFFGSMIVLTYVLMKKFVPRESKMDVAHRYKHQRRVIMVTAFAIFVFTAGFRPYYQLFYFDSGPWITTWAATRISVITTPATAILEWAFFMFMFLACAATALLLYYVVVLLWGWSQYADSTHPMQKEEEAMMGEGNENMEAKIGGPISRPRPRRHKGTKE